MKGSCAWCPPPPPLQASIRVKIQKLRISCPPPRPPLPPISFQVSSCFHCTYGGSSKKNYALVLYSTLWSRMQPKVKSLAKRHIRHTSLMLSIYLLLNFQILGAQFPKFPVRTKVAQLRYIFTI